MKSLQLFLVSLLVVGCGGDGNIGNDASVDAAEDQTAMDVATSDAVVDAPTADASDLDVTDAGAVDAADADPCGPCPNAEVCCMQPKSPLYGHCYSPGCLSCCM